MDGRGRVLTWPAHDQGRPGGALLVRTAPGRLLLHRRRPPDRDPHSRCQEEAQVVVDTVRDHWWWRPGWRLGRRAYTFHITFEDGTVEGGPDLHRLTAAYQASLAGMPGLDLVPLQWLHLTMQNVGFTDEVGESDVQAVA